LALFIDSLSGEIKVKDVMGNIQLLSDFFAVENEFNPLFTDASGTATFTETETKILSSKLTEAGRTFRSINSMVLNRISSVDSILTFIKTFNNTKVREGQKITNTTGHTRELIKWIEDKLNKDILAAKMEKTKRDKTTIKNEIMRTLRGSAADLTKIFDMQNGMVDAKNMIIKKLQQMKQVTSTFVQTEDGFKVTNPEGFVAVDKLTGNAVKLVDRLEFSHLNFTAQKNWSK
jgi:predicted transcriptional regulator